MKIIKLSKINHHLQGVFVFMSMYKAFILCDNYFGND